jgi:hypothetical protein
MPIAHWDLRSQAEGLIPNSHWSEKNVWYFGGLPPMCGAAKPTNPFRKNGPRGVFVGETLHLVNVLRKSSSEIPAMAAFDPGRCGGTVTAEAGELRLALVSHKKGI